MRTACLLIVAILVCGWCRHALAAESKVFVAYSMKAAQQRVEAAVKQGQDFRSTEPELYYLGGITKPWAVVLDTNTGDWILVGEQDPSASALTLDDWVAALRARFLHPDQDPGVTIDPDPCPECRRAGVPCKHFTRQQVRFFAGVEDTHFGQVCYQADWLMKRIGLGLEKLPVPGLRSYYDLALEQARSGRAADTRVGSRFWFYPIVNRVNVLDDVVLLEKFQMGVFTEVLYAEVNGNPVQDMAQFEDYPSDGFSRSFSESYDQAAQAREVLDTLRGLTRLAALAKGLTQVDTKPPASYYLTSYPGERSQTPEEVEVLRVENGEVGFEISGGVSLTALAVRLKGGDAGALKDLVLAARASDRTLSWKFVFTGEGIRVPPPPPDSVADLFAQGDFLFQQKRYDLAIACWRQVLRSYPEAAEVYLRIGQTFERKGMPWCAVDYYNQALALDPFLSNLAQLRAAG